MCTAGWSGVDCSQRCCPSDCSGHGDCAANFTCMCDGGWTGYDCSMKACPADCSGNGECYNGTCYCTPGLHGSACTIVPEDRLNATFSGQESAPPPDTKGRAALAPKFTFAKGWGKCECPKCVPLDLAKIF